MKTNEQLATEAKIDRFSDGVWYVSDDELERFAALVRAQVLEEGSSHLWCEIRQDNDMLRTMLRALLSEPSEENKRFARQALGDDDATL